jgi:hypothetical protein
VYLSIPLQGKNEVLTLPTVSLLVKLLLDQDPTVKCKAALALESIAITTPGKYSCLKEGAINNLVHLIDEPLSETRVNALKVIACLAESPEGRKSLQAHVDKVIKNKLKKKIKF